jgi:hypothetical protein
MTTKNNSTARHYAPFMDADAIQARENAESARLNLAEFRNAWEASGSPRGGREEAIVAAAFAAWEDASRWASAEARRCIAAFKI